MAYVPQKHARPSLQGASMDSRQQAYFRGSLLAWQADLQIQAKSPLALLTQEKVRPPDPMDQGVQELDLQQHMEKLQRSRHFLREVEAALARIDDGSFGYCQESGEEIGLERVPAMPVATPSIETQEQQEQLRRNRRAAFSGG